MAKPPRSWSNPVISPGPGRKLNPQQHLKETPTRDQSEYRRCNCEQRRNSADQDEARSSEQSERDVRAETLENDRHCEQSRNADQNVVMTELHRLAFGRAPAINADEGSARHYKGAEQ